MGMLLALFALVMAAAALMGSYAYYRRRRGTPPGSAESPAATVGFKAQAARRQGARGAARLAAGGLEAAPAQHDAQTPAAAADFYLDRARVHLHAALHAEHEQESARHIYAAHAVIEEGRADPGVDQARLQAFDMETEMLLAADDAACASAGVAFNTGPEADLAGLTDGNIEAMVALLDYYKSEGVTHYEWVVSRDCCEGCRQYASTGPHSIEAGIAGTAPVPWRDSHRGCRCTLVAAEEP